MNNKFKHTFLMNFLDIKRLCCAFYQPEKLCKIAGSKPFCILHFNNNYHLHMYIIVNQNSKGEILCR